MSLLGAKNLGELRPEMFYVEGEEIDNKSRVVCRHGHDV